MTALTSIGAAVFSNLLCHCVDALMCQTAHQSLGAFSPGTPHRSFVSAPPVAQDLHRIVLPDMWRNLRRFFVSLHWMKPLPPRAGLGSGPISESMISASDHIEQQQLQGVAPDYRHAGTAMNRNVTNGRLSKVLLMDVLHGHGHDAPAHHAVGWRNLAPRTIAVDGDHLDAIHLNRLLAHVADMQAALANGSDTREDGAAAAVAASHRIFAAFARRPLPTAPLVGTSGELAPPPPPAGDSAEDRTDPGRNSQTLTSSSEGASHSIAAEQELHMAIYAALRIAIASIEKWQHGVHRWQVRAWRQLHGMFLDNGAILERLGNEAATWDSEFAPRPQLTPQLQALDLAPGEVGLDNVDHNDVAYLHGSPDGGGGMRHNSNANFCAVYASANSQRYSGSEVPAFHTSSSMSRAPIPGAFTSMPASRIGDGHSLSLPRPSNGPQIPNPQQVSSAWRRISSSLKDDRVSADGTSGVPRISRSGTSLCEDVSPSSMSPSDSLSAPLHLGRVVHPIMPARPPASTTPTSGGQRRLQHMMDDGSSSSSSHMGQTFDMHGMMTSALDVVPRARSTLMGPGSRRVSLILPPMKSSRNLSPPDAWSDPCPDPTSQGLRINTVADAEPEEDLPPRSFTSSPMSHAMPSFHQQQHIRVPSSRAPTRPRPLWRTQCRSSSRKGCWRRERKRRRERGKGRKVRKRRRLGSQARPLLCFPWTRASTSTMQSRRLSASPPLPAVSST